MGNLSTSVRRTVRRHLTAGVSVAGAGILAVSLVAAPPDVGAVRIASLAFAPAALSSDASETFTGDQILWSGATPSLVDVGGGPDVEGFAPSPTQANAEDGVAADGVDIGGVLYTAVNIVFGIPLWLVMFGPAYVFFGLPNLLPPEILVSCV